MHVPLSLMEAKVERVATPEMKQPYDYDYHE